MNQAETNRVAWRTLFHRLQTSSNAQIELLRIERGALSARVAELEAANVGLATEAQRLKAGLRFYAHGTHYAGDEWEDVSGEPPNWLCNPHGDTVEDGSIAKIVLLNQESGKDWEADDEWPPDELPEEIGLSGSADGSRRE